MRSLRPLLRAALAVLLGAGCGQQDAPLAPTPPARPSASLLGGLPIVGPLVDPLLELPRLLLCPTDTELTASAVVGPEGGVLGVGGFRVTFPAGAVPEPQRFVLTVVRGQLLEIEVHAEGHAHYQFAAPVTVRLDLSRCLALPLGVEAWHIDSRTKALLERMGGELDLLSETLEFRTTHFSGYSVAW